MKKLFFLPNFNDEDKQRIGQYLNIILLSAIGLLSILMITRLAQNIGFFTPTNLFLFSLVVVLIVLRVVIQSGYIRVASLILVTITWAAMTYQAYTNGGIGDVSITAYIVVILMASLLLGWQYSLPFYGFSIIAMYIMAYLQENGIQQFSTDTPTNIAIDLIIIFSLIIIMTYLLVRSLQHSIQEAKASSQKLLESNKELQVLQADLEQRVADRTHDLAVVAEVGTATATFLETGRLLQEVVNLTKERFNLYHSHIYILDESGENLVLAAGAGDPGRQMVAEKHSIPLKSERSLVARAARERKGIIVNDVTQAPDFLPNPLLPDTRSELAVPLIAGESILGVFDIQSDTVGRFTESDVSIQTTLAAQVAISLQNARSFEKAKAQADLEALINSIGQKIQRTVSIEDTLQTAARALGLAIGAARVKASLQTGLPGNLDIKNTNEVEHA